MSLAEAVARAEAEEGSTPATQARPASHPSHVYPLGSRLNGAGHLEIGGCDVLDLAREFGTPAYVYAEDHIRARAAAYRDAFAARTDRFEILYASKAFPHVAVNRILSAEGLSCDVASGGELFMALRGGFGPERIYLHGNNKSEAELRYAVEQGVGHIVVDSFDELERLERIAPGQAILLRVTPGIEPATHAYISTGQEDSKFGFGLDELPRAIERAQTLDLRGLHAHIGSQIFDLEPFGKLAEVLAAMGDFPLLNLGGGLGIAYTADQRPPSIDEYVESLLEGAPEGVTVLCEPGRSLVGNAGVTLYTVGTVKEIPGVRTYVAVDGGMSDNPRPMLYGARYEADIADRMGGERVCAVAGKHCESGDVLIGGVALDDPRPGDVLVTPVTGAYADAMASNYNALPRPPVVFCRDGDARLVTRRETYEDLALRDLV
ncbi:MAG: Diaminopimelate decarboxylase [uncultured Solirubrobacterales bacterium]|uniref:Diaminopimelate decarboxylase n=1 Tax=uncultured Solirubrobacterales bacterium TaxID=768556 RepID=A0A6J4RXZ0_9ACTN|nr:MAG: Diaminopimelate decarboxylase [uncultured Solirubrobacterales bacterium]